jgi:hypothetical protein
MEKNFTINTTLGNLDSTRDKMASNSGNTPPMTERTHQGQVGSQGDRFNCNKIPDSNGPNVGAGYDDGSLDEFLCEDFNIPIAIFDSYFITDESNSQLGTRNVERLLQQGVKKSNPVQPESSLSERLMEVPKTLMKSGKGWLCDGMKAFMSCGCMHGFEKPRRPSELQ